MSVATIVEPSETRNPSTGVALSRYPPLVRQEIDKKNTGHSCIAGPGVHFLSRSWLSLKFKHSLLEGNAFDLGCRSCISLTPRLLSG